MKAIDDFLAQSEREHNSGDLPLVTLTYAQSFDGSLALRRGAPIDLSGDAAYTLTHRLRAWHDALLVGIGTVLSDDPQLTVRFADGEDPQPVILDSQLRLPATARLHTHLKPAWVFCAENAPMQPEKVNYRVFPTPADDNHRLELRHVLQSLHANGIRRLMVEGGAGIIEGFLHAGLVNIAILTIAPIWVGGVKSIQTPLGNGKSVKSYPHLRSVFSTQLEENLIIWGNIHNKTNH